MEVKMFGVVMLEDPIFFPSLKPYNNKVVVPGAKPVFNRALGHYTHKGYNIVFWGQNAETAALTIRKRDKLNLVGFFKCQRMPDKNGKKVGLITFHVTSAAKADGTPYTTGEFDYTKAATTGKFGNARVYIKGKGFLD